MAVLTAEDYAKLPALQSKSLVGDIVSLHLHTRLPRTPATIVTDTGHYRLPGALQKLAVRAYAALAASSGAYEGPRKGRLEDVLRGIAGDECEAVPEACEEAMPELGEAAPEECEEAMPEPREAAPAGNGEGHVLQEAVEALAEEALGQLEGMVAERVTKLFAERRGAMLAAAVRSLAEAAV